MTSIRPKAARLGGAREAAALAGLALGLASCSTDLGDLVSGDGSKSSNPLDQTPGWSRQYPNDPMGGETSQPGTDPSVDPGGGAGGGGSLQEASKDPYVGPSWCNGRVVSFCADFDEDDTLLAYSKDLEGANPPVVDTVYDVTFADSTALWSNSLYINVPPAKGDGSFASKLTRHFDRRAKSVVLEFELAPEKVTGNGIVAAIDFNGNPQATYSLRLVFIKDQVAADQSHGTLYLEELRADGYRDAVPTDLPFGVNAFTHLRLEATLADNPSATLSVDPDRKGFLPVGTTRLTLPESMSTVPTFILGIASGVKPHDGWRLRYDNVLFDIL